MVQIRQSRPSSGFSSLVPVLKTSQVVPSSLGSGSLTSPPPAGLLYSVWVHLTRQVTVQGLPRPQGGALT